MQLFDIVRFACTYLKALHIHQACADTSWTYIIEHEVFRSIAERHDLQHDQPYSEHIIGGALAAPPWVAASMDLFVPYYEPHVP
jgi:hypothetical protein